MLENIIYNHILNYPTPNSINYVWSFGSLLGFAFAIQILTGVLLAMHYVPNMLFAVQSIQHIIENVNYGWLIRDLHKNGASLIFFLLYIHLAKGLYFRSYRFTHRYLWISGVLIFLLMMITAFVGYILPWGQMSFWGATVITNTITSIPIIGNDIAEWLWGGFSVSNPTLNRFYSLHYLLPFVTSGLIFIHLALLHEVGSSTRYGLYISRNMNINFSPYFTIKDVFSVIIVLSIYTLVIFYFPNMFTHPENFIEANALITPTHIVPEWYFLPFYAMLRSFSNKLVGTIIMLGSILILLILPFVSKIYDKIYDPYKILWNLKLISRFHSMRRVFFFCFFINFLLLGFIAMNVADLHFVTMGIICTILYFVFLIKLTR